ncbi:MAG: gliding motility-associated C-terminal domain-containing protein [Bacteroidales bacterium]|nr:gliding motility-associated C-terminal domain-containing protein [Bacteroidales bacterium]
MHLRFRKIKFLIGLLLMAISAVGQEPEETMNVKGVGQVEIYVIQPTCPSPSNATLKVVLTTNATLSYTSVEIGHQEWTAGTSISPSETVTISPSTVYTYEYTNLSYKTEETSNYNFFIKKGNGDILYTSQWYNFERPDYSESILLLHGAGCGGQAIGEISFESVSLVQGDEESEFTPKSIQWIKEGDDAFPKHKNENSISNLGVGTYYVNMEVGDGCMVKSSPVEVTTTNPTISATVIQNVVCKGEHTGYATATVGNVYGDYKVLWYKQEGVEGEFTIISEDASQCDVLPAGENIKVTVTDEIGCSAETSIKVTEPEVGLTLVEESRKNLLCRDVPMGEISFLSENGTGTVEYSWKDDSEIVSPSRTELAGDKDYTITVKDEVGCEDSKTFRLEQPETKVSVAVSSDKQPSCYGYSDGSITVAAKGGTVASPSDYTYAWMVKNGDDVDVLAETGTTISSIPGGETVYMIVGYDANGCESEPLPYKLDQPKSMDPVVKINGVVTQNVALLCNAEMATVEISATGGTGTKSYDWGDGVYNVINKKNLEAGAYNLNVKDANGCIEPMPISIAEPDVLTVTIVESQPIACYGEQGELQVVVTGGSGVYQYDWSTGSKTDKSGQVKVGKYSVTVSDENGCSAGNSYELNQPDILKVHISVSEKTCTEVTLGELLTDVNGGTADYTYAWSKKESIESETSESVENTTESLSGLDPKTCYQLVVTDANGCTAEDAIDMKKIATYQLEIEQKLVSCSVNAINQASAANTNDGILTAKVVGGYTPFDVSWTDGKTTRLFEGVDEKQDVGKIWKSDKDYSGTKPEENLSKISVKNVPVGTYTATVTDFRGCVLTQSVELESVPQMKVKKITATASACKISTGKATVLMESDCGNGKVTEFKYDWIDDSQDVVFSGVGKDGQSASGLAAQTYTLRVTDTEGCVLDVPVEIVQKSSLKVTPMVINDEIHCAGGKTGSAIATASNDNKENPTFKFEWSDGKYDAVTGKVTNLPKGIHTVTVTDEDGCTATGEVEMKESDLLHVENVHLNNVVCYGEKNGSISITEIKGGVEPYSLSWNTSSTSYTITDLAKGTYTLTISDNSGCSVKEEYEITEPDKVTLSVTTTEVQCPGNCDGSATVITAGGTAPYRYKWDDEDYVSENKRNNFCLGDYFVSAIDVNGCLSDKYYLEITGREEVLKVSSVPDLIYPKCGEAPSGKIRVIAEGTISSSPATGYSYYWTRNGETFSQTENSINENTILGLSVGTYKLHLTDGTCYYDETFVLKNSDMTAVGTVSFEQSTCVGDDYTLHISNEATAGYHSYAWINMETGQKVSSDARANGLKSGQYMISAVDKTGCEFITDEQIENKELKITTTAADAKCYGSEDGMLSAVITNTTGTVTYEWYSSDENVLVVTGNNVNVRAGKYYVLAYDENHKNCKIQSEDVVVGEPDEMIITPAVTVLPYCGFNTGKLFVEVAYGVSPFTYEIRNALGELARPLRSNLPARSCTFDRLYAEELYSVRVTDANGCVAEVTKTLYDSPHYTLQGILTEPVHCVGDATAELTVVVLAEDENRFEPYTYIWSHSELETGNVASGLPSGNYQVTVQDSKGCKITYKFDNVQDAEPMALDFYETPGILCYGGEGNLLVDVSAGGSGSYVYEWYDGEDNLLQKSEYPEINDLKKGAYKVVVEDSYGCSGSEEYFLKEPSEISPIFDFQPTGCGDNEATGSITLVDISGGVDESDYRFRWNNEGEWIEFSSGENRVLGGLTAGEYLCTVTNAKNPEDCFVTQSVETNPLMPMSIEHRSTHARCNYYTDEELDNGASDGSIEVTKLLVSSGDYEVMTTASLDDYTFLWNDRKAQTGVKASNLIAGEYEVTVTAPNGCSKTFDAGEVTANISLTAQIMASEDSSYERKKICFGDSLELTATVKARFYNGYMPSMEEVSFKWESVENNCGTKIYLSNSLITCVKPETKYYSDSSMVRMTYQIDGCSSRPAEFSISHYDSVGFAIEVLDTLGVSLGFDSVRVIKDLRYLIKPTEEPWYANGIGESGIESIIWRSYKPDLLDRGSFSDTVTNAKTYNASGEYGLLITVPEAEYIYAFANTTYGCRERAIVFVDVYSSDFIPSGFTPNGDGINDTWVISYLINCPKAKVTVFNRWGTKVYENKYEYYSHPWDGTASNGNPLPMGTYYYVIEYNDKENTPTKTGSVSILR